MMSLCLSGSRINNTFSISMRYRKKKSGLFSISFLVHPGRSPGMMSLCLSASRIYNTFSISTRSRKYKLGSCSILSVHPGRSPGMMLLCLKGPRIQLLQKRLLEKMCTRQSRKVIWDLINTLFLTLYLLNLLLLLSFSIWKHRSMVSCAILSNFFEDKRTQNRPQYLSELSRALFPTTFLEIGVYNTFSISSRSRKKNKAIVLYPFCSPR